MKKYSNLLLRFALVSFRNESEFRTDFWLSVFHNLLYQAIFLIFWQSILSFTAGALGDWTFPELAVLSAFTLLSTAIMQLFRGFITLPGKVVRGDLDKYLSKPISPLFALLAEDVNALNSWRQMFSSGLIIVAVFTYFKIDFSLVSLAASLAALVVGCLVMILLQGFLGLLAFWWGDVSRVSQILMISAEFERYPLNVFPIWLQRTLIWVIPIGLISTYPVLVLFGEASAATYLGIGFLLAAFWSMVFLFTWRRALGRYESFGG